MAKELTPEQIEKLQKDFEQLTAENATLKQAEIESTTKITALEMAVAESNTALETAKSELETANDTIAELGEQLANKSAAEIAGFKTVTHDKKEYLVKARSFNVDGEIYTDENLANHPKVIKKLVEIGSGILEVVAK